MKLQPHQLITLSLACLATAAAPVPTTFPAAPDVEVSAIPEKNEVATEEPLAVDIIYRNTGKNEYVIDEDQNGDFFLHACFVVRDDKGRELSNPYNRGVWAGGLNVVITPHKLSPGGKVTIVRTLNECVRFTQPGKYTIEPRVLIQSAHTAGKEQTYFVPKTTTSTVVVKPADARQRTANIDALLDAYTQGKPNLEKLPIDLSHLSEKSGRPDIVRTLAFFDEPRLIPFFLNVMETEDWNNYAFSGLLGLSDRKAVLQAFEARLDHPESHDVSRLLTPYADIRFIAIDMATYPEIVKQRKAAIKIYRDKAITMLKADTAHRYPDMAQRLCDGGPDDEFLKQYLQKSQPPTPTPKH